MRAWAPFATPRPRPALATVVVDNASADGTVEMIRAEFPEVTLVANDRNTGFAAASNRGIRLGSAPYVLALNPDTRVPPGALDRLIEVIEARPRVAVCGCRLEREDGSFDHAARRSFPTVLGALGHFTGAGRGKRAPRALAQYRAPDVDSGEVDAVNGAFMLMRRAALDEVGLFDEGYWMYMEDLDLCFRLREAGWVTWYEPSVTVTHVKGGTTGGRRDVRLTYAFHRGMLRFYRTHYAPHRSVLVNGVVYAGIAVKLAWAVAAVAVRSVLRSSTGAHPCGRVDGRRCRIQCLGWDRWSRRTSSTRCARRTRLSWAGSRIWKRRGTSTGGRWKGSSPRLRGGSLRPCGMPPPARAWPVAGSGSCPGDLPKAAPRSRSAPPGSFHRRCHRPEGS